MSSSKLHKDSSNLELIEYCAHPPVNRILGGTPFGNQVVKLSDNAIIKFGGGVTEEEAENQRRAFDLIDPAIVRVPRVYRFFMGETGLGYLIMEYVAGKIIEPLEDPFHIERIARVLTHFASLRADSPGTLSGGPSRGLIFPEAENIIFASVKDMETWFNSRLFPQDPKLSLQGVESVLCHLDLASRNILWQEDGSICLLDWASAGYYPRVFEFCAQWIIEGMEGRFNTLLIDSMESLSDREMEQRAPILRAWRNCQLYSFDMISTPADRSEAPDGAPSMPPYEQEWLEEFRRHQAAVNARG